MKKTVPSEAPLPDYKNPPVIEVVCGVQFKTLRNFLMVHFGAYWNTIKDNFPNVQDIPPLPQILDPGIQSESGHTSIEFELSGLPPLRRQFFINKSDNGLIQVQNNRFHYNWRKAKDEDIYIRFPKILKDFLDNWALFNSFVEMHKIGSIQQVQYELTYINHLLQGELWVTIEDLVDIITPMHWSHPKNDFLPSPDGIAFTVTFPCPKCSGHLILSLKKAKRKSDDRGLFIIELTVRGKPIEGEGSIEDWFMIAREWIVRGFTSITSEKAHRLWERKA